ncbi:2-aminoethylphosphonate--pyruvate transaminase [Flammeovirgaceae bacterium SG7u.111]|nr:2-aminoethylphosphonate--pyruvate transaminase [Flammeovirgaceae bacterium SG7u.132]WPO37924.1 2-aminoethylphosphonate--pyruvate transaminase [Flammeovirgaceae bacterium SG7u.111]
MDNPYLLLTPGPLSTSNGVRNSMLQDWCTWDDDYNKDIVSYVRNTLCELIENNGSNEYTSVLLQGSGTFAVESVIGSCIKPNGHLLVISNGAYGDRIAQISKVLGISFDLLQFKEYEQPSIPKIEEQLKAKKYSHVIMVHCETTTGILNNIQDVAKLSKAYSSRFIVDAMSSFGGIPIDLKTLDIDCLISSANKCIQGVPGFGFVLIKKELIEGCKGIARSLSLDLYAQWKEMEDKGGKWRFTSPTHVVRAFKTALEELKEEGGIEARYQRYKENQSILVEGMQALGFEPLVKREWQSPFITSFLFPKRENFEFNTFYHSLKKKGFVIYPGKISDAETFRIGSIGHVFPEDFKRLLAAVEEVELAASN